MALARKIPAGIKVIIAFFLLSIVAWTFGQGGTVVDYDRAASWGMQESRDALDPVIVEVNRGIGLADMLIQMPLFVIAVVGLWRMRFYGAVAAWMVLGTTIYWPVVFWCSQYFYGAAGIKYQPMPLSTNLIPISIFVFALWASWYLYRIRRRFDR